MKPEISLRTLKVMGYYVGIGVIEPFSPLRARGITADSSEKEKRDYCLMMNREEQKKIISKNIKRLRKKKGITQKELSGGAGIPDACISDYERRVSKPQMRKIRLMAAYFGVETDEITDEERT